MNNNDAAQIEAEEQVEDENMMDGMYLTFALGDEAEFQVYGLEICHVIEIIQMQRITKVPDVDSSILGVINLRGKVIPVVDLRASFMMEAAHDQVRKCIIVVNYEGLETGLIVDEMRDVVYISEENIQEPPSTREYKGKNFVQGIGKLNEEIILLLDLARFVVSTETSES